MPSALSFTVRHRTMVGPGVKLITGTLVLANPHDATGDVVDLSGEFSGVVYAGWMIDDFSGYKVDYAPAALGDPATGRVHAWRGNNNGGADGVMITSAAVDLHLVTGEYAFVGY